MSASTDAVRVLYVEPVGGHRGLEFYDLTLCHSLMDWGIVPALLTCEPTDPPGDGLPFEIHYPFKNIYGTAPKLVRGFWYLLSLLRVASFGLKFHGQIIHYHFPQVPLLDWLLLRWLKLTRGYRLVVTVHDVMPLNKSSALDRFFLRSIYHAADGILVHAEASRRELQQLVKVRPDRVRVVPISGYTPFWNRTCPSRAEARAQLQLSQNARIILFFGQIKRTKGLEYLIQALPEIVAHCPNTVLVIAGPEGDVGFDEYADWIHRLGVQDHVELHLGYVSDARLPYYFLSADVVALPYVKVYQSAVLTLAQSFGAPIVASATGGIAEVLQDGVTGWLVPPCRPDLLAEAILHVLVNPMEAAEIGRRGRDLMLVEASPSEVAFQTARIYRLTCEQDGKMHD